MSKKVQQSTALDTAIDKVMQVAPSIRTWRPTTGGVFAGEFLGLTRSLGETESIVLRDPIGKIIEIEAEPWMKAALAEQAPRLGDIVGIELRLHVVDAPIF